MKRDIIMSVEDVDLYLSKNCEDQKHIHDFKVNESGVIECFDCPLLVTDDDDIKNVKRILNEQYGEFWKEKFKKLMYIKKLVMNGKVADLRPVIHGFENDYGQNIGKIFYEPK